MNVYELVKIVKKFFGYKARQFVMDSEKQQIRCILYDAFLFECGLDGRYGTFGGGIVIGNSEHRLIQFLGNNLSSNVDEDSINKSLEIVDQYCRLRLPDKFIEAYDVAYAGTGQ